MGSCFYRDIYLMTPRQCTKENGIIKLYTRTITRTQKIC